MLITNTFYNVSAYSGKEYFKASNEEQHLLNYPHQNVRQ